MEALDEKDYSILDVLKTNSSLSIKQISKKTLIPVATVHNRIKKMRANGIITGYTIKIDKAKLGKKMVAYVLIKAVPKADHIDMLERIVKHEAVEDGSAITGAFDLIIKIRLADIDELDKFVLKHLRTFNDIAETQTMIAYRNISR